MNSKPPERLRLDRLATPIGEALIVTDEAGLLRAFDWADREPSMARLSPGLRPATSGVCCGTTSTEISNAFEPSSGAQAARHSNAPFGPGSP